MAPYHNESTTRLLEAILSMNSVDELRCFFEDLCTVREIQDMAQRLDTAVLLDTGMSYQKIAAEIGVSTATISRVNRCLVYGEGGYRTALDRMKKQEETKNAD